MKKYFAEMVGTMVLVLLGCGAAVALNCGVDTASVIGTAFAFGLAVVAMAYTIGGISGCHINPAITLGVWMSGRMSGKDACWYMVFQVIGACLGAAILYLITSVTTTPFGGTLTGANTCAGVGNVGGGLLVECILTFIFVLVVLGTTDAEKGAGKPAGLAIGLSLVLIHLVGIHFTGTSVNPARSIGPALFEGGRALKELWVFIVGPLAGGALAACVWKCLAAPCKNCKKD
ncbi:MAG: MIP family channel protein [Bacteroidales bacterium]|nr:MIP family channel protein [Bacteroidales bacterium]MBP5389832.1 MIP family channel protein [Bacteroidales bacterium]MBP5635141.1 MIP family channel protein [Bacteroidales bacterium]MBR0110625.1 MIP family channel protein [Bacteroidales bacterium]